MRMGIAYSAYTGLNAPKCVVSILFQVSKEIMWTFRLTIVKTGLNAYQCVRTSSYLKLESFQFMKIKIMHLAIVGSS